MSTESRRLLRRIEIVKLLMMVGAVEWEVYILSRPLFVNEDLLYICQSFSAIISILSYFFWNSRGEVVGLSHVEDKEGIDYWPLFLFVMSRARQIRCLLYVLSDAAILCVVGSGCVIAVVVDSE